MVVRLNSCRTYILAILLQACLSAGAVRISWKELWLRNLHYYTILWRDLNKFDCLQCMITKCYDEISIGLIFSWAWLQNAMTRFQWGLIFSRKEQLLAKEFRFCCGKSCFFAHRRILQTKYRVSVRMLSVVLDSWCFCACWPFLISFFFCQQRSFFPFFLFFITVSSSFLFPEPSTLVLRDTFELVPCYRG